MNVRKVVEKFEKDANDVQSMIVDILDEKEIPQGIGMVAMLHTVVIALEQTDQVKPEVMDILNSLIKGLSSIYILGMVSEEENEPPPYYPNPSDN